MTVSKENSSLYPKPERQSAYIHLDASCPNRCLCTPGRCEELAADGAGPSGKSICSAGPRGVVHRIPAQPLRCLLFCLIGITSGIYVAFVCVGPLLLGGVHPEGACRVCNALRVRAVQNDVWRHGTKPFGIPYRQR